MKDYQNEDDVYAGAAQPRSRDSRGSWRQRVALLRQERRERCEECGARHANKRPLQFAHIRPTGLNGRGRGQTQRFMDIMRNPDAYLLLCGCCHRKHP